jgi:hypothetical protein
MRHDPRVAAHDGGEAGGGGSREAR